MKNEQNLDIKKKIKILRSGLGKFFCISPHLIYVNCAYQLKQTTLNIKTERTIAGCARRNQLNGLIIIIVILYIDIILLYYTVYAEHMLAGSMRQEELERQEVTESQDDNNRPPSQNRPHDPHTMNKNTTSFPQVCTRQQLVVGYNVT